MPASAIQLHSGLAEMAANILICLIRQANYPLNHQVCELEKAFLKEGGLRERMSKARTAVRSRKI